MSILSDTFNIIHCYSDHFDVKFFFSVVQFANKNIVYLPLLLYFYPLYDRTLTEHTKVSVYIYLIWMK